MKSIFKFLGICFFAVACSSGSSSSSTTTSLAGLASCAAQSGDAVICGTVLAADGTTPVANATLVRVGTDGNVSALKGLKSTGKIGQLTASASACVTDDAGAYACQVDNCSGTADFRITSALFTTALNFSATCTLDSVTNVETTVTTATSAQGTGGQWLVIPGSFDGVQLLLSQIKGCTLEGNEESPASMTSSDDCEDAGLTVLDSANVDSFLASEDLSAYQAIFANCDADFSSDDTITTQIRTYVNNGGNMYFSDLTDTWLTTLFPSAVTFPGVGDKNATSSGELTATVADTGLQVFLGSSSTPQTTIALNFDLPVWTAIASVEDTWTTYIEGDISSLAGTLTGTRPITVGGPQEEGCLFYTSYHVEGAATAGADQEQALKYLALNRVGNCD